MAFTFKDNAYNCEKFFQDSISSNFAGWYNPGDISNQIKFITRHFNLSKGSSILDLDPEYLLSCQTPWTNAKS